METRNAEMSESVCKKSAKYTKIIRFLQSLIRYITLLCVSSCRNHMNSHVLLSMKFCVRCRGDCVYQIPVWSKKNSFIQLTRRLCVMWALQIFALTFTFQAWSRNIYIYYISAMFVVAIVIVVVAIIVEGPNMNLPLAFFLLCCWRFHFGIFRCFFGTLISFWHARASFSITHIQLSQAASHEAKSWIFQRIAVLKKKNTECDCV